jgi:predicted transcriptional regulator
MYIYILIYINEYIYIYKYIYVYIHIYIHINHYIGSRKRALTNSMGFNTYVTENLVNETDNRMSKRDSFLSKSVDGSYDKNGLNHYVQNELHKNHVQIELHDLNSV